MVLSDFIVVNNSADFILLTDVKFHQKCQIVISHHKIEVKTLKVLTHTGMR